MEISRRHVLVWLAFWWSNWTPPARISLCVLFWRALWGVIAICGIGTMLTVGVVVMVTAWKETLKIVAVLIVMGVVVASVDAFGRWRRARRQMRGPGLLVTAYEGIKHRFCPIVTIREESK